VSNIEEEDRIQHPKVSLPSDAVLQEGRKSYSNSSLVPPPAKEGDRGRFFS